MADMLSDGAAWMADQLAASASLTVAYKRGINSSQFLATIGKSVFESSGQNAVTEQWESRDYIVKTADLPYGEPLRGDLIVEDIGGVSVFYEVTAPRGVPLFHYGDAFQNLVRVHTKQADRSQTFVVTDQGEQIAVPLPSSGEDISVPLTA
jgi:hypothetical protein